MECISSINDITSSLSYLLTCSKAVVYVASKVPSTVFKQGGVKDDETLTLSPDKTPLILEGVLILSMYKPCD